MLSLPPSLARYILVNQRSFVGFESDISACFSLIISSILQLHQGMKLSSLLCPGGKGKTMGILVTIQFCKILQINELLSAVKNSNRYQTVKHQYKII